MGNKINVSLWLFLTSVILLISVSLAGTTGKIAGTVVEKETQEPLVGANVFLEGTLMGAAVDMDGSFYIINVPPGPYILKVQMIGYADYVVENVQVSVNLTTFIQVEMSKSILEGEVVTVTADKMSRKKGQTSTVRNVSAQDIQELPVESVGQIIQMQAGVVGGHWRGGRTNEVRFMVDGMNVTSGWDRGTQSASLETEAIQEIEIITGTFNAEYGEAMSGLANAVTKDGGADFHGSVKAYAGNYMTTHDDVFVGVEPLDVRNQDYRVILHGPVVGNEITFFANVRYENNLNYLNGVRRFSPYDYSDYSGWPNFVLDTHSGDSSYVSMNPYEGINGMLKLTFSMLKNIKLQAMYNGRAGESRGYNHQWKYNPDGRATNHWQNHMFSVQMNHMINNDAFYELKLWATGDYSASYLFEDPFQTYNPVSGEDGYYFDNRLTGTSDTGFLTGGQEKQNNKNINKDYNGSVDLTWQLNKMHGIKTGVFFTQYDINRKSREVRNLYYNTSLQNEVYQPVVYPDSSIYSEIYSVEPRKFEAYAQDKMEVDDMTLNFGLRFDYFDPNTTYPSNWRNPARDRRRQIQYADEPERMSTQVDTDPQIQLSPRLGLAYKLGETAKLHFSYGHFFQTPPFYAMYSNNNWLISAPDYSTTAGNPSLKAEKSVAYELGYWQQLIPGMDIEITIYYKDIYNLLTLNIVSTYNNIRYGLYGNKDYANSRGLELQYNIRTGAFLTQINYSMQYTRGNADNPNTTFDRAGNSQDPIPFLLPLNWDQRHTFNVSAGYNKEKYGITATGYYNSGHAYTWVPIEQSALNRVNLYVNNAYQPSTFSVDLRAHYMVYKWNEAQIRLELMVYNLLDWMNEVGVNATTGRANQAIVYQKYLDYHKSSWNTYYDRIDNPGSFSAPRLVKLGLSFTF
jgi:outer membrane receptor protein involved in Fe transport